MRWWADTTDHDRCPSVVPLTSSRAMGSRAAPKRAPISDDAVMDVAPTRPRPGSQPNGDGVVGFLVVGSRMPVRGVIRAGHPAARLAQPQLHPVVPAGQALLAAGRVRPHGAGGGAVAARAPPDTACLLAAITWHQGLPNRRVRVTCGHVESTARRSVVG